MQLIDLIMDMQNTVANLEKETNEKDILINQQKELIEKQENQLNRNSQNSSKPPSTDGFVKIVKPKSERVKSGKLTGGQLGHIGITLKQNENPDIIEFHEIDQCVSCSHDLSAIEATYSIRQEIDIPKVKPIITEHKIASKACPHCKKISTAKVPDNLTQSAQYGPRIKALVSYLHHDQLVPLLRVKDICSDLFDLQISEGSIVNMHQELFENLAENETVTKEQLLQSHSVHFDETGFSVNGILYWLHSASTDKGTLYFIHTNRGSKAINSFDILTNFEGIAIHDHWKPYFLYTNASHALCNAHHIRELRGMFENYDQPWAKKMLEFLITVNKIVNDHKNAGKSTLSEKLISKLEKKYDAILNDGLLQIPQIESHGKRGRQKQHPVKNLHNRFVNFKTESLRFMKDFQVSFTNNQAERDIRMTKVKQKISGGFRSIEGANRFCRIRGFISTSKKHNVNVFQAMESIMRQPKRIELSH